MILTIGPGGCGFTFLNWTISYLRGDASYNCLDGTISPVDINPLDGATAHKFQKDHLKIENSKKILDLATDLSIVYLVPGSDKDFENSLLLPGKKIIFDPSVNQQELLARSYMVVPFTSESIKVYVDRLSEIYNPFTVRRVFLDCARFFTQYYTLPDQNKYHYYKISHPDLFQQLDLRLDGLFQFLKIQLDHSRLPRWKEIYQIYKNQNIDFTSQFLGDTLGSVDPVERKLIFEDLIKWKNERYRHINAI